MHEKKHTGRKGTRIIEISIPVTDPVRVYLLFYVWGCPNREIKGKV
jgi:hypothetical protein